VAPKSISQVRLESGGQQMW